MNPLSVSYIKIRNEMHQIHSRKVNEVRLLIVVIFFSFKISIFINGKKLYFCMFDAITPFWTCMYSFGYFPGDWLLHSDVSEHSICSIFIGWIWSMKYEMNFILHIQPMKMEQIECSETSAHNNQSPGKYPKEYIQDSKHGESLKSRTF